MRRALLFGLAMVFVVVLCGCQNTKTRAVEGASYAFPCSTDVVYLRSRRRGVRTSNTCAHSEILAMISRATAPRASIKSASVTSSGCFFQRTSIGG